VQHFLKDKQKLHLLLLPQLLLQKNQLLMKMRRRNLQKLSKNLREAKLVLLH
jgi:hypothetical protein